MITISTVSPPRLRSKNFYSRPGLCINVQHRGLRTGMVTRATHYEVLSLPKSAPCNQIKARFYKLSKELHPDVNPSKEAKERYLKISEAYSVLGDEKRRREYDRSLQQNRSYAEPASSTAYASWMHTDLNRRRGATHAWERTRRAQRPGPGPSRPDFHASYQYYARYNDYTFHGTAKRKGNTKAESKEETPEQKVSNESVMWRVVQVIGVLWLVVAIGSGWSAHS